jgi:GMP synthase-like glutamine amidotransferase
MVVLLRYAQMSQRPPLRHFAINDMTVHILQHVPFEGPGMITDWCRSKSHPVSFTRFYAPGFTLPDPASVDLLVVMGGPMGVYDEKDLPWLSTEKTFLAEAMRLDKRILGVCLGAQLLASVAGASVGRAPQKEIGWFEVFPTEAAAGHPWFYALLKDHPVLFHWHGDRFEVPPGASNLAFTEANDNQAFLLGDRILGLQFHGEIRAGDLAPMVKAGSGELQAGKYIQSPSSMLCHPSLEQAHAFMRGVLTHLASVS